jgi:phosphoserine aminotransferase
LVIIKKDTVGKVERTMPTMLNYKTHLENDSLYNTPPVIAILVCMHVLDWLKSLGGVSEMQKINQQKFDLFYGEVDSNPLFVGTAAAEDRSPMNACFLLKDATLDEEFLSMTKAAGIVGIKGHRSVGGFRASMYNALPLDSVKVLVEVMKEFGKKKG